MVRSLPCQAPPPSPWHMHWPAHTHAHVRHTSVFNPWCFSLLCPTKARSLLPTSWVITLPLLLIILSHALLCLTPALMELCSALKNLIQKNRCLLRDFSHSWVNRHNFQHHVPQGGRSVKHCLSWRFPSFACPESPNKFRSSVYVTESRFCKSTSPRKNHIVTNLSS